MDREETEVIQDALRALHSTATNDCHWIGSGARGPDPCDCQACVNRRLFDVLHGLITPVPTPISEARLCSIPERIYFQEWVKLNERHRAVNSGYTYLEHILNPRASDERPRPPQPVTMRDAVVAATVVQWLGTNCGMSFMHETERKIREAKADRALWENQPYVRPEDRPLAVENVAAEFVGEFCPPTKPRLRDYMLRMFRAAVAKIAADGLKGVVLGSKPNAD